MKLGMVGLGRMGGNMSERLRGAGHEVVGYDRDPAASQVPDLPGLVEALGDSPRVVWVMVPSGLPTDETVDELHRLGVRSFVETGPGKALTGMVRRSLDGVEARVLGRAPLRA